MYAVNPAGPDVMFRCCDGYFDRSAEFKEVARKIHDVIVSGETKPEEIAVIARMRYTLEQFEKEFVKYSIPYSVSYMHGFFDRREVKDMLAYLRFLSNHSDIESFQRIINVPTRGVGLASANALLMNASLLGCTPMDILFAFAEPSFDSDGSIVNYSGYETPSFLLP